MRLAAALFRIKRHERRVKTMLKIMVWVLTHRHVVLTFVPVKGGAKV